MDLQTGFYGGNWINRMGIPVKRKYFLIIGWDELKIMRNISKNKPKCPL